MILLNELKKLLKFKNILIVIIISIIIYQMFIRFHIEHFPNGRTALDIFKLSLQATKDYERNMDENEFKDFKRKYDQEVEKADAYIRSDERFAKLGFNNYQNFRNMDPANKAAEELSSKVYFEDNLPLFWELQAREYMMELYEQTLFTFPNMNKNQIKRVEEVKETKDNQAILPNFVIENYNEMIKYLTILILLSIMFIISPIYISDKRNKLHYLQYTSKKGRELFKTKIAAGFIASLIITTSHLICFFIIYSQNGTDIFFNTMINSFLNGWISWYNITFGEYILLTVTAIYLLTFIITGIALLFSSISPNFMTVIGANVPVAFLAFGLGIKYLLNNLTAIDLPQYFQVLIYGFLLLFCTVFLIIRWKKEKGLNIIN